MDWLIGVDWTQVFLPDTPLLEIFVRGTCMYLGIFLLLRVMLRREAGMVGLPDVLMIVLLADAAQNGMADDYRSLTDGLTLVGVIVFWNLVLDRLTYHFAPIERLLHPPPLPLIRDGRVLRANLRRESISNQELWSQLRMHGIEHVSEVKSAYVESNGEITVVQRKRGSGESEKSRRRPL